MWFKYFGSRFEGIYYLYPDRIKFLQQCSDYHNNNYYNINLLHHHLQAPHLFIIISWNRVGDQGSRNFPFHHNTHNNGNRKNMAHNLAMPLEFIQFFSSQGLDSNCFQITYLLL